MGLFSSKITCPRCKSANVQLLDDQANVKSVKSKSRITPNLNPLHPLTIANSKTKTKVTKKHSKAKTAAAIMTMGTSTIVTGGTRSNKSREYHCQDCSKTFYKK